VGECGDRQGGWWEPVCGGHGGTIARPCCGAWVLRLSFGGGHRADGQPVPAGPISRCRPGVMPTTIRWSRWSGIAAAGIGPRWWTGRSRCIPDERFDELFAQLGSHRDRALVAFWVSTGARASELLGATLGDVDPGQQLITVIRKGTRAMQSLPGRAGCVRAPGVGGRQAAARRSPARRMARCRRSAWWTRLAPAADRGCGSAPTRPSRRRT
jgi:hypothetical protein